MAQRNEAPALELLDEHRQVPREVFAAHGSWEVEAVGDGFFVEFSSALDGVRCAIEIQERLASRNRAGPTHRRIRVRNGLHIGDVVAKEGPCAAGIVDGVYRGRAGHDLPRCCSVSTRAH